MDDNAHLPAVVSAKRNRSWQRYHVRKEIEYRYTKTAKPKTQVHPYTPHLVALVMLWTLGFLDLCLTSMWIGSGEIEEGNPVMLQAYETWGIEGFAAIKLIITTTSCIALWIGREYLLARVAVICCIVFYSSVVTLQIVMLHLTQNTHLLTG
mgnify:CR=1 FL=1|tara:strand:- start:2707 stop:3162 length:456 start_codon:yes stop_codon:yes gene_type:complete